MPTSSGQQIAAWSPAATPSLVCPSMILAPRPATEMSASKATTRPAPTAGPRIAETTGLSKLTILSTRSRASRMMRIRSEKPPMVSSIKSKLPPEENALPSPRTSTARTLGSRSISGQMSARSRCICGPTELRPGASRITCKTPSVPGSIRRLGNSSYLTGDWLTGIPTRLRTHRAGPCTTLRVDVAADDSFGQPRGERHDRQRRIRAALRRTHRTVGDEKVRHRPGPLVGVDDAAVRVAAHPRAADEVGEAFNGQHVLGVGGMQDVCDHLRGVLHVGLVVVA